jgi:uncharacterized protein YbjT (DUF2867 family)
MTVLVAGGSGLLGRQVVAGLVRRGLPVRVLSRDPGIARETLGPLADRLELVAGDVRDPSSLIAAMAGVTTVVAAVQGFGGRDAGGIRAVDLDGNLNLVRAAAGAGAGRFVLLSIHDASATDSLALGRAKAVVETELRGTTMAAWIVRPTAYMETWAGLIGGPILAAGKARVFGRGRNPINFVAASDVARVVERAVVDPSPVGRTIEVVGPEDLTFDAIVERFADALGRPVPIAHVPLPMLRLLALAVRPLKPVLADQIAAAIVLDTTDRHARVADDGGPGMVRGATTFDSVIRTMVADAERVREAGTTTG